MRLIDADELKTAFPCGEYVRTESVRATIDNMPTIEPERKKGRWIHIRTDDDGNGLYECSECHKGEVHVPIVEVKYCWNCGALMEEGEQDG